MRLLKVGPLADAIPARVRPWLAVGLGTLGSMFDAQIAGTPVTQALMTGLAGAAAAMAGHDLLSSISSPKDGAQ